MNVIQVVQFLIELPFCNLNRNLLKKFLVEQNSKINHSNVNKCKIIIFLIQTLWSQAVCACGLPSKGQEDGLMCGLKPPLYTTKNNNN